MKIAFQFPKQSASFLDVLFHGLLSVYFTLVGAAESLM